MKRKTLYHFLVHSKKDNVGVAVVDIKAGSKTKGLIMDSEEPIELESLMNIPLGHKISLRDLKVADTVVKYGYSIGQAIADIKAGEYVHVHNVKTKRW